MGFTNGVVKVLDALNLQDEDTEPFRYARDVVTHIKFSHNSEYLATAVCTLYLLPPYTIYKSHVIKYDNCDWI